MLLTDKAVSIEPLRIFFYFHSERSGHPKRFLREIQKNFKMVEVFLATSEVCIFPDQKSILFLQLQIRGPIQLIPRAHAAFPWPIVIQVQILAADLAYPAIDGIQLLLGRVDL